MLASREGKVTNMGKGNRSRQDRALETVNNTDYETAPKNTKLITTIATAAVACLLVACLALSAVVNTGILVRSRTVAKTDNFSASGSIAAYLIYAQAQEMAALYQQYGLSFTYNVDDSYHAQQFDKAMNYLLEENETEGNVVEYKHVKYTTEAQEA